MKLNQRETEILTLVSEGNSYKQIQRTLKRSVPTIKSYIRSSKDKLGARSICHAVALFVRRI